VGIHELTLAPNSVALWVFMNSH